VSAFSHRSTDQDRGKYIVTHNVLAEVWELPPNELKERYDERLDWLEDVDIAVWVDDDEPPEEVLVKPKEEEPEDRCEEELEERLEERFEEENPERTEVNSDASDDSAFDDAEENADVWDTDILDEVEENAVVWDTDIFDEVEDSIVDVDDGIGAYVKTTAGEAVFVTVTVTGG
jgi:hypothetical protein